jgi:outer membrane receptor protein involved in Fe transport
MMASKRSRVACAIAVILTVVCLAGRSAAQTAASGNIEGLVTDTSGGVLPGVTVTVRNLSTNATRELVTESSGRYRAAALQPGRYEVSASLSGFQATPISNIEVNVGQTAPVDLRMRPAGVAETVTVSADAPVIDTRKSDFSSVIGQAAIENLPVVGRRWDNFVLLSPGVTNDGNFGLVSYRGISGLYNNNMVDGVDNNQAFFSEARGRTRISYAISESSIKEFQVGVSNMSAEFGRSAGGSVNAVTKSGGNTLSGQGFYFIRDKSMQAKNPFITLPTDPTAKPDERRQQFGGALGGPIRKDKVFFFVDYDQQVRNFPVFTNTAAANFYTGGCTAPAANCAAATSFFNSLQVLNPRSGDNKVGLAKVDVSIDQANTLSLSVNSHRWNSPNGVQTQPVVSVAQSQNGSDLVSTDFFVGSLNSIISQRWLNEFRTQAGRDNEEQTPNGVPPSTTVTGGINFGMPNFLPRAAYPHEQRYQFLDSLTYYRGNHSIKFGADVNYVKEELINLFNGGGTYAYSNLSNIAQDCPIGAANCTPAAAGTLTGRHYSTFTQAFDLTGLNGRLAFNEWNNAFYVNDTWHASNALTLTLGLRYDYQQLPEPGLQVDGVSLNGNPAYPLTTHFSQDRNNFGPRLGAAYDFGGNHDTVLRAGYGVFYGLTSNSAVANALTNNAISQASYTFTPTSPGAPAYPATFSGAPNAAGAKPNINVLADNLQRPTIQMVDVTVDHRIAGDVTLSASYLYSHGANLPIFRDINFSPANSQVSYVLDGQTLGTFPLYRGTRPDPNVGSIFVLDPAVTSRYNGLVLSANKRFSKGLLFNTHYTLSKAVDNGQESTTFFSSFGETYDPLNLNVADGETTSSFDRRHRFVGSVYYRPDYLWGIGVSSVITLESGLPINENISGSLSAAVGAVSTGSTNGSNGALFAPFVGRNADRLPGRKTVDFRASKEFSLGAGKRIEVLAEVFNLFNWLNYTGASATAFNVASSTYDAAANQATVTLTRNTGFLVPTTIGNTLFGMREGQIGLKLHF